MYEIFSSPYFYAAIVAIAAFVAAIGSDMVNKQRNKIESNTQEIVKTANITLNELKVAGENINQSLGEAKQANSKLDVNKDKIIETLNKTIENKEATLNAQATIIGMLTGGDSYPTILLKQSKGFYILVNGEYGIPNLDLQIVYIKDFINVPINSLASYLNDNVTSDNIAQIYSHTFPRTYPRSLHSINLSELNIDLNKNLSHGFDFIFTSDYKKWIQRIRLIPINGKWEILNAFEEVFTQDKDKTSISNISRIYFKVSDTFPNLVNHGGNTYGNEFLYYMLDNDKRRYLNSSRLFNDGIEITEKNITEPLDIDFFNEEK